MCNKRVLLQDKIKKAKLEIRNRYLAGETIKSIAKRYGMVGRTVYFHIGKLSPADKSIHALNSPLQKIAKKQNEDKAKIYEPKQTEPAQKRPALDDFIQAGNRT